MNRKAQFGGLMLMFLGVIVALSLLPAIANNAIVLSEKTAVVNETLDISSAWSVDSGDTINASKVVTLGTVPTGWDVDNCPLEVSEVLGPANTTLTVTTDYVVAGGNGTIRFLNTVATNATNGNTTHLSYTLCPDGYVSSAAGRSMSKLILLFAALGLIAFAIFYLKGKLE